MLFTKNKLTVGSLEQISVTPCIVVQEHKFKTFRELLTEYRVEFIEGR